ncbi:hypothetical protein HYW21_06435 [Candidatus Woesearchaeota archaeon]|nr:hypothetical protein [Candidatus Woesearchaeota archaeon]
MGNLKALFDILNDPVYCRYTDAGKYSVEEGGHLITLNPRELLEVGRSHPREQVMIAYFGETPTRVLYVGEDSLSMQRTLDDLRLPTSWSSNLGEKVFYLFRVHLRDINQGPVCSEQQVAEGKERQFELVLRRLIDIYRRSESGNF